MRFVARFVPTSLLTAFAAGFAVSIQAGESGPTPSAGSVRSAAAVAATTNAAPAVAPAGEDPAYTKKIEERTAKLVADLHLTDPAQAAAVHAMVLAQYRALNAWHEVNDAKLKPLAKSAGGKDAAATVAKAEIASIKATLRPLHDAFLAKLAMHLPPDKVEEVKDLLTYHKVRVTYQAYLQQQPKLGDEDKAKILAWLKEAREEAIDGGSADEKSEVFGKYKGRINNYLSQRGFTAPKGGKPSPEKP